MKHIILTGGGTAGHVTPNIALIPALQEKGYKISYIGSYNGIEKQLIEELGIPYYGIASGKLRRYFDLKNFSDPFRVIKGYFQAKSLMKKLKPDVVFSKGGFVTVPVVIAAGKRHIPAIIHESDMTPGLANKLCLSSATKVCCNFPETVNNLPKDKAVLTGTPIRQELLHGNKEHARAYCGFTHICGKGKTDESIQLTGYVQYEYVQEQLPDMFALADVVISRAGANAICELAALSKPHLLIPLSAKASRGDQILNARSFERQGYSMVLEEEEITEASLLEAIRKLYQERNKYIAAMSAGKNLNSIQHIVNLIEECIHS